MLSFELFREQERKAERVNLNLFSFYKLVLSLCKVSCERKPERVEDAEEET